MSGILVFHVQLDGLLPAIWRRLEIRADRTFWDLHCAIQDAMPWEDLHLHEFRFPEPSLLPPIGIPDPDFPEDASRELASWRVPLATGFVGDARVCNYLYDFGDEWHHTVTLEARERTRPGVRYPRCTGGERACPPEDVGGPPGYFEFLTAMLNPAHPEHQSYREWVGRSWDPSAFAFEDVLFGNPKVRLRQAGLA
ncbi:MAG: plasmid pRiA4b ORF-3 family protein [Thermoanaerobaculia bacterium]|nr:plasmid pRiA4b ORF-3 family protein [Thermoanaerobaculia bacterium]